MTQPSGSTDVAPEPGTLAGLQGKLMEWFTLQPEVISVEEVGDGIYGVRLIPTAEFPDGQPVSLVLQTTQ